MGHPGVLSTPHLGASTAEAEENYLGTSLLLRRRFKATALVILVPLLLVSTGLIYALMIDNQSRQFARVFEELDDGIESFGSEIEIATYGIIANLARAPDFLVPESFATGHFIVAEQHFIHVLEVYAALRASDPDGPGEAEETGIRSDSLTELDLIFDAFFAAVSNGVSEDIQRWTARLAGDRWHVAFACNRHLSGLKPEHRR